MHLSENGRSWYLTKRIGHRPRNRVGYSLCFFSSNFVPLLQTLSNEIDDWKGEKRHRSKQLEINNYPRQFGADLAFWCNGSRLSTRRRSNLQNYLKTTWPAGLRPVIDASLRDSCSHMIRYQSQKGAFSSIALEPSFRCFPCVWVIQ